MRAPLDFLQGSRSIGHMLASGVDRLTRWSHSTQPNSAITRAIALLRGAMASWPEPGSAAWPRFPVHGRGTYNSNVAVLTVETALIRAVLPANFELGGNYSGDRSTVLLFFGHQSDVRPDIWPLPGWAYDEAVFAVPNVFARDARYAYQGPFVFVPRLWLDRLSPVLAGILLYGYSKILTRIEASPDAYVVRSIGGETTLAQARFEPAGPACDPRTFHVWHEIEACLNQPILTEPMPGVEIGSVLSFRTHRIRAVQPLHAELTIGDGAAPGFAGGRFNAAGMASIPAAFRMRSHWHITPPIPRSWFTTAAVPVNDIHHPIRRPVAAHVATLASTASAQRDEVAWLRPPKRRIAVLGGGVGALCAVWALTQAPDWRERFDITVYQIGWRLGGKGASGRNKVMGHRIEEHGLHIWAGFYENAFRIMRSCYAELNRPPGSPLATIEDAFKPQSLATLEEQVGGDWRSWNIQTLQSNGMPGGGDPFIPQRPIEYLPALLSWLATLMPQAPQSLQAAFERHEVRRKPMLRAAVAMARARGHAPRRGSWHAAHPGAPPPERLAVTHATDTVIHDAVALALHAAERGPHQPVQLSMLIRTVRAARAHPQMRRHLGSPDDAARRIAEVLDLGFATIVGMIADGLVFKGFAAADGEEWRDWLRRHGANERTLQSATVRATYDYVFGFVDGDVNKPALAAGTTTHGLLRLTLTYKGAFFWTMQAGMGDTVFTPLYQVLRQRGVNFAFFHKVDALRLGQDRHAIERIELTQQATLSRSEYNPLVSVDNLECWPSEPNWNQIVDGDALRARGINFEEESGTTLGERLVLVRGQNFHDVILGISLGGLPAICRELIDESSRWRAMVEGVRTVATLGVQLWLRPDLDGLGWTSGPTIATAYEEPLDTWADMSRLLAREKWPQQDGPGSIIYFCGPLQEQPARIGTTHDPWQQQTLATQRVEETARQWLARFCGHPWPRISSHGGGLELDQLYREGGGAAAARLDAQYFRANVIGSSRYVQSVPHSTELRIRPGESGFDNLYLAGDWVRTGINAGCVEAAAMGGLAAAAAMTGQQIDIVDGEERPLAATLAEHALNTVYGTARTEATVIVAALPLHMARRLLPPDLALATQPLTQSDRYPVILMFARQRDARPSILPIGMTYHEFIIMLPSVRRRRAAWAEQAPRIFAFLPKLYLDSVAMLLLGRVFYGYAKDLARVVVEPGSVAVRSPISGESIVRAELYGGGGIVPVRASGHYADVAWLLNRPILSRGPLGSWRASRYDFVLEDAVIQILDDVSLTVFPFLQPSLSPEPITLRTGEEAIITAFRLWADTSLSNPFVGLFQTD